MPAFLEPQQLIETLGLLGVVAIIFAESGLFFGFFLPGDSLLFTAGFLASQDIISFVPLLALSFLAAVSGDAVGYAFGKKVGEKILLWPDSVFFKKRYIEQTSAFYERYGRKTIILARFVPVVRTFAPILAGIGGMRYRDFLRYNIIGGFLWVCSFVGGGYFLGSAIPEASRYIELIIAAVIVISLIPVVKPIIEYFRSPH